MPSKNGRWLSTYYPLILSGVLLVAAFLRIFALNHGSPPGLEHDEVAHWLINQEIISGEHGLYFSGAYGHEAGYHYLQSGVSLLLGDNALALRLPSVFLGLLVVAISFALTRRLFGLKSAILSASLLAALFWPVFYSRLGLRAIALPFLSGLSAYFWWAGWQGAGNRGEAQGRIESGDGGTPEGLQVLNRRTTLYFTLAGLFAGLSFYTYMASRVVPIFYLAFVLYLLLVHRAELKERWRGVTLTFIVYAIIAAPLALYLLNNPGVEFRLSEINQPLNSLKGGNIGPALENGLKALAMFGLRGDPLWRQNVANLPVFEPLLALFFYIGVVISAVKWAEERYMFVLLWLMTAAIPSIVTIDAPSSIRIINVLPVLTIFPVLGLQVIHFLGRFSTVSSQLSPKNTRITVIIGLILLFSLYIVRTSKATLIEWPSADEVKFVWQEALTDIAAYLDSNQSIEAAAVGGWTPESMDPPTMELSMVREDLELRYFDPLSGLILPRERIGAGETLLLKPAMLPMDPFLEENLLSLGARTENFGSFSLYGLTSAPEINPKNPSAVKFSDEVVFLGFNLTSDCPGKTLGEFETTVECQVITYWQVENPPDERRRIFLHLVDGEGQIADQDDGLGAPVEHWKTGDLIMQRHELTIQPDRAPYTLRLGVYDPEDGTRLLTVDGREFFDILLEE